MQSTLCLVIDRLHCGFLGCYGNSWVDTPEFDHLASESFVFDQALADTPDLARRYLAYWQGASPLTDPPAQPLRSLARRAAEAGAATCLVSDDAQVFDHPLADDFAQVIPYRFPSRSASATQAGETNLAEFFAAASEALRTLDATSGERPYFLWLHTQGLGHAWDAPLDLRRAHLDDPDEIPPEFVNVPNRLLPADVDPDERLALRRAYAAQVALLDACLGTFFDELRQLPVERQPLVAVVSPRGFPLGEHGAVGAVGTGLHAELVHVPWLIRFPDGLGASVRSQSLVLPSDLPKTLADAWGLPPEGADSPAAGAGRSLMPLVRGDAFELRDRAVLVGDAGERALRTPAWHLRRLVSDKEEARNHVTLYAKPDDRWEVNEVADRCHEIAERLSAVLDETEQAARERRLERDLTPLDGTLVEY
jgi:arylsulfatase A-like enzyme